MTTALKVPPYTRASKSPLPQLGYISHIACVDLLNRSCECLVVTPAHLSRLLGMRQSNQVYDWLAAGRRPTQVYTARLARLLVMQIQGQFSHEWYGFNWDLMRPISQVEFAEAREVFYNAIAGRHPHDRRQVPSSPGQSGRDGLHSGAEYLFPSPRTPISIRPD